MDILGLPKAKISNFAKQISLQKRSVRKTVSACFVSGPDKAIDQKPEYALFFSKDRNRNL